MKALLLLVLLTGCGRTVTAPECQPVFRDTIQTGSTTTLIGQCP